MKLDLEIQEVNLIITALEHKSRDTQLLLTKIMKSAQEQMPVPKLDAEPVENTPVNS
jgi:hypothetical protein